MVVLQVATSSKPIIVRSLSLLFDFSISLYVVISYVAILTLARTWGVDATPQVGFVLCTPCF